MNAQDFVNFAIATLKADPNYANVDMSPSSAFYNATILPFCVLAKPIQDSVDAIYSNLNISSMSDKMLDDLATQFFVTRQTSSLTNVNETLYFTNTPTPTEPIVIYTTDNFYTASGAVFHPIQDYVFAYSALPLDLTSTYKIANITLVSTSTIGQIQANTIQSTTVAHPLLFSVTNDEASSVPVSAQTNAEFIQTLESSLSERSLSKAEAIIAALRKNFYYITDVTTIGYGNPEMQRDIAVAGKDWSGHFGGMTDVYVQSNVSPTTFTVTATRVTNGYQFTMRRYKGFDWNAVDLSTPLPNALTPWVLLDESNLPILPVVTIDWANSSITNTTFSTLQSGLVDYTVEVMPDPGEGSAYGKNFRYSIYEHLVFTVHTATTDNATETVTLRYSSLYGAEEAQTYLMENADVNSSLVLKSYIPIYIPQLNITYDSNYSFDHTLWAQQISDSINAWNIGQPIRLLNLLADFPAPIKLNEIWGNQAASLPYVLDGSGNITDTQAPTGIAPCYATMLMNNIDGSVNYYLSTQQMAPVVNPGLSTTYITARYFIYPANIVFTPGSW